MGRSPCCDEPGLKKGPWTPEEDHKLVKHIQKHGHGSWRALPKLAGLNRCGKSCRLRWTNYLRPDIKRGKFSQEEEQSILNLHSVLGNKWSAIASHLPGRTDNEIKNFWNTHLKKKLIHMGFDPMTHRPRTDIFSSSCLPHLLALANLKQLMQVMSNNNHVHYSWEELQAATSQAEMANKQLYLLQQVPSTSNTSSSTPAPFSTSSDLSCIINNLLNSSSSPHQLGIVGAAAAAASLQNLLTNNPSISFSHMPDLHVPPCNSPCQQHDQLGAAAASSSKVPSTPSVDPPPLLTETSMNNNLQGDHSACSTLSSSSSCCVWPELLFEDPLFHEIA